MIVYKDYVSYLILGKEVNLISDETSYGLNTVAEIEGEYHYLGEEPVSLQAAIFAWQKINGRFLEDNELVQILKDNSLPV
jgi:hypothetical protein